MDGGCVARFSRIWMRSARDEDVEERMYWESAQRRSIPFTRSRRAGGRGRLTRALSAY